MAEIPSADLQTLTADIVAAYVTNNKVSGEELPTLIGATYQALSAAGAPAPAEPEGPPMPDKAAIRKSQSPEYLTSFLDGRRYKSLKRHLSTNGLSPDEYRSRFGLPKDYPMVAPAHSAQRSELARSLGLGRRAAAAPSEASPAPQEEAKPLPAAKGRRRSKSATDNEATTS